MSQLDAQKNLFGVGAFVGASDTGATVGVAVTGDVVVTGSAQSSGLIWKHASVMLLQVAQVFVVSKHSSVASIKPDAHTLNNGVGVGGGVGVGASVGSGVGAGVSGGQSRSFSWKQV